MSFLVIILVFRCFSPAIITELGTFEWWISGLMLNPLFFLISRLNIACSPLVINPRIINRTGLRIFHSKVFSSVKQIIYDFADFSALPFLIRRGGEHTAPLPRFLQRHYSEGF